jgi:hypothetical protein
MIYTLFALTPREELKDTLSLFFEAFNPFEEVDTKNVSFDVNALRSMIIITIPQGLILLYKTLKGLQCWVSNFDLRETERYYRISLAYILYVIIIRILILVVSLFKYQYLLIYAIDFLWSFMFLLQTMRVYIEDKKIDEIEEAKIRERKGAPLIR